MALPSAEELLVGWCRGVATTLRAAVARMEGVGDCHATRPARQQTETPFRVDLHTVMTEVSSIDMGVKTQCLSTHSVDS